MDIVQRLIKTTAAANSLRHQVPIAAYRERLALIDAKCYAKDKAVLEAELTIAQARQGAAMLALLTCGYSHRTVLRIVRGLKC